MTTWPDLAGRLDDGVHVLPVRVYYEDTDFTGIVYHGAFVRFFERGRSDFLRLAGIHHAQLKAGETGQSLAFAVRTMNMDFRKPATIDIQVSQMGSTAASLVLEMINNPQSTTARRIKLKPQLIQAVELAGVSS